MFGYLQGLWGWNFDVAVLPNAQGAAVGGEGVENHSFSPVPLGTGRNRSALASGPLQAC